MSDKQNAGVTRSNIKFCDLNCEYAAFPRVDHVDGANSCRTFVALWCDKLDQLVTKNAPCALEFGKRRPKSNL
ncbi:hypothetical protein GF407_04885 [candidate division KSB1 bacterium]|nr:hypothetical protein [candidate division KSB1 bacterium]